MNCDVCDRPKKIPGAATCDDHRCQKIWHVLVYDLEKEPQITHVLRNIRSLLEEARKR